MRSSSSSSSSSEHISSDYNSINSTMSDVDTKTLPRIAGSRRDAELWKFRINDWFKREGITTDENKFSYIIAAVEDDIVRVLKEKEAEVNKPLTLDECVKLIKKKYWRENQKDNKLRQLKRIIIEPNETVYDFNTRYLELYDLLETEDRASISVIDYENALRPRTQIYTKIAMEECDSLEDACSKAEKYEKILQESHYNRNNRRNERNNNYSIYSPMNQPVSNLVNNSNNSWKRNGLNFRNNRNTSTNIPTNFIHRNNHNMPNNFNNNGINNPYNINNYLNNRNNNYNINNNQIPNNDGMDDLVNRMQNLQIKTCYFCNQPSHLVKDCTELAKIKQDPNFINYFNLQKN